MMRRALVYALLAAALSLAVVLVGVRMVAPQERAGVYVGVVVAFLFQALAFWLVALWLFRGRMWIAYVLQMLGRFVVLGVMAFVLIPATGVPVVPALMSLVVVFFSTTLVEPVLMKGSLDHPRPA